MRERIDIEFFSCEEPLRARKCVEELCTGALPAALDAALSAVEIAPDELLSIDRLEVDVTGLTEDNLEVEMVPAIIRALNRVLRPHLGRAQRKGGPFRQPVSRSILDEVCFFLEHGFLPWPVSHPHEWQPRAAQVLSTSRFDELSFLISLLAASPARLRFVRHFPSVLRWRILPQLWGASDLESLLEDIDVLLLSTLAPTTTDLHLRDDLFGILLEHGVFARGDRPAALAKAGAAILQRVLRERPLPLLSRFIWHSRALAQAASELVDWEAPALSVDPRTPAAGSAPRASLRDKPAPRSEPVWTDEPVFIKNAGLVILAPYLPQLFAQLGIADKREILSPPEALALTHYLVFGSLDCWEWDLVLGKILCGVPLAEPVRTPSELSPEQMAEANALLREVIRNWQILKNTSIDGLREAFLQREGILSRDSLGWRLRVDRKAHDVLLDALPWTISMIRLPWMECMLTTDWGDG